MGQGSTHMTDQLTIVCHHMVKGTQDSWKKIEKNLAKYFHSPAVVDVIIDWNTDYRFILFDLLHFLIHEFKIKGI